MFRRYRQRRGPYALAKESVVPSFVRSLILLLIVGAVLYFVVRGFLGLFGLFGGGQVRTPVTFTIENRGTVNVSLEGGLMQRGDNNMKLYALDKIASSANGHARLAFFDGSWVRTDNNTEITIEKSSEKEDDSAFALDITKGSIWISTPPSTSYSGTIVRTVTTPAFTLHIPADTQAIIEEDALMVFSAEGNGVGITLANGKQEEFIGEGQQMILTGTPSGSALKYRSAIDPLAAQKPFVQESRQMTRPDAAVPTGSGSVAIDADGIVVTAPTEGAVIAGNTVTITGKIGTHIEKVRINGHLVTIDTVNHTFTEELALNAATVTEINIDGLDANDSVLDQVTRTVKKAAQSVNVPTITSPAGNGQTYRTQADQIEIKGKAPTGASGMMVNDYKLQLFRTGDTSWTYLASKPLNNLVDGKNIFNVYALDADGNPSAPATVTVLIEPGIVGVVSTGSTVTSSSSSAPAQIDEATLPQNAPLNPGTLAVTGPQAGTSYTATGSEILIEGTTSTQTAAVWVNGYKLQLYRAGTTTWNYIAKVDFGTLKKGTNVYVINARDKDGKIVDTLTYTVTY